MRSMGSTSSTVCITANAGIVLTRDAFGQDNTDERGGKVCHGINGSQMTTLTHS